MSEIHSRAPLAFYLIGSLIRQASSIGGMTTNIGFILLSTQFKARWKTGKSVLRAQVNMTRLYLWLCLGCRSILEPIATNEINAS